MASRKSTGSKMKAKGPKASRATASAPKPPAPLRVQSGLAAIAPKPQTSQHTPSSNKTKNDAQSHAAKVEKPEDEGRRVSGKDAALTALDGGTPLKKQELIAKVVERSDIAKKHAKPVIEAMLEVLGDAIADGREMNLQPMGKIKRKRVKESDKARVVVANIRQPMTSSKAAPLPGSTSGSTPSMSIPAPGAAPRHPLKEAVADSEE